MVFVVTYWCVLHAFSPRKLIKRVQLVAHCLRSLANLLIAIVQGILRCVKHIIIRACQSQSGGGNYYTLLPHVGKWGGSCCHSHMALGVAAVDVLWRLTVGGLQ